MLGIYVVYASWHVDFKLLQFLGKDKNPRDIISCKDTTTQGLVLAVVQSHNYSVVRFSISVVNKVKTFSLFVPYFLCQI